MEQISSETFANHPELAATRHSASIWAAWLVTLLISNLPLVIARDVLGSDIPWILPAWLGTVVLFFAATFTWQALKPLRKYLMIMAVVILVTFGLHPLIVQTGVWTGLVAGRPEIVTILAYRILLTLETLIVLGALLLMGIKRREAFLQIGDMRAPLGGRSAAPRKAITWPLFGTLMALLLGGLFFAFMASQSPSGLSGLARAVPWIPLILLSAGLNAFVEEGTYRAGPLSTLLPAVGPAHALILTSLWFGLGHYYGGIPSGVMGLVQAGLVALLLGKAMLDTRGMAWSWIIHVVLDTIIYTFIAIG